MVGADIISVILSVFAAIGEWIITQLSLLQTIFWTTSEGAQGELTFMGVLAVAGLGFAVVFLIIGIIQKFLKFRG